MVRRCGGAAARWCGGWLPGRTCQLLRRQLLVERDTSELRLHGRTHRAHERLEAVGAERLRAEEAKLRHLAQLAAAAAAAEVSCK